MNVGGHSIARCSVYSIVAALAALFGLLGSAAAQGAADRKPVWQTDAQKFGLPKPRISMEWPKILVSRSSFGFLNNTILLVSWITPDAPLPPLPKRKKYSPLPVVPAHLHVLFLDAKTGTKLREHDLPVPSAPTELLINHSGNLMVRAGDSVRLYAPDFRVLNEVELQSLDFVPSAQISPDGRRIMLHSRQKQSAKLEILDTSDLRLIDSLLGNPSSCDYQLGNDFVLGACFHPQEFLIYRTGKEPQLLEFLMMDRHGSGFLPLVRLTNDDTLIPISGRRMAAVNMHGRLLFTDTLPKRYLFFSTTTARDSERFAVEISHLRGLTVPNLDMYAFGSPYQLRVYSLKRQESIFAVKLKGMSPWTPWKIVLNSFALSPDGSLLAILTNDSVRVYELP